jgi:transcriptional regulator with XRE-family HTH domain
MSIGFYKSSYNLNVTEKADKFANWLKEAMRQKNNMTQEALGDLLPASQPAIGNWLKGANTPKSKYIPKLAEIFDADEDDLLILAGHKSNKQSKKDDLDPDIKAIVGRAKKMTSAELAQYLAYADFIISSRVRTKNNERRNKEADVSASANDKS